MPGTPPGQQRDCAAKACLPFWMSSFHLLTAACAKGCRIGLLGSAIRGITVQPCPFRQKGNLGSFLTGPGRPSVGARKSKLAAAQPIFPDEKSGTPGGSPVAKGAAADAAPARIQPRAAAPTKLAVNAKRRSEEDRLMGLASNSARCTA